MPKGNRAIGRGCSKNNRSASEGFQSANARAATATACLARADSLTRRTPAEPNPPSRMKRNMDRGWRPLLVVVAGMIFSGCAASAQEPASSPPGRGRWDLSGSSPAQRGTTEWGWTSGGAVRIAGGIREGHFWAWQLRWGRVLTSPHGPGLLRGTLEYAVELVPAMLLVQSRTAFGGGLTPILLQYNFTSFTPGRRLVPFLQAGAGMLFTTREFPEGTTPLNFTPQGGIGMYWLRWPRSGLVFGARYHHISNAGRVQPNPGHNALYLYGGFSWWR